MPGLGEPWPSVGISEFCQLHCAVNYPSTRLLRGEDDGVLKQRQAVYKTARQRNPGRWSGKTRNWDPVTEVWLNPPPENQAEKGQILKAA